MAQTYPELGDKTWLTEHYVDRRLSGGQVAELVGCTRGAVEYSLRKFGIPRRGRHYGRWNLKTCDRPGCGQSYTPSGPAQRFCSDECRAGTAVCQWAECGRTFTLRPAQTRNGTSYPRKFCSMACRRASFRAEARERRTVNDEGYVRIMLDRRVQALGTKTSGSWQLTVTLTLA
jgi:hypothetical protein